MSGKLNRVRFFGLVRYILISFRFDCLRFAPRFLVVTVGPNTRNGAKSAALYFVYQDALTALLPYIAPAHRRPYPYWQ